MRFNMISLRILSRNTLPQLVAPIERLHTTRLLLDSDSSSDSSDDEKKQRKPKVAATKTQSVPPLNSLLRIMAEEARSESKINVAIQPKEKRRSVPKHQTEPQATPKPFEQKLVGAAKDVATSLGGDVVKTESDLLNKILASNKSVEKPVELSTLVLGMKIDRSKNQTQTVPSTRADHVRAVLQKSQQPYPGEYTRLPRYERKQRVENVSTDTRVNLDSGVPLGIFNLDPVSSPPQELHELSTWQALVVRDLKLSVTHPPIHYIDQMIRWTDEGKLWRFPINNEQDMDIEKDVHFSEHIFLEQHLENWCPLKGPVRHFMELVCVGLSKNPYMTAKEKKDHIYWFKDYFNQKQDILKELGAYDLTGVNNSQKQIDA